MTAEMTPRGMAMAMATAVAMIATCSDSAKRSLISWMTGKPVHME